MKCKQYKLCGVEADIHESLRILTTVTRSNINTLYFHEHFIYNHRIHRNSFSNCTGLSNGHSFLLDGCKNQEQNVYGIPKEWVNINVAEWFKGRYFDIFPVSLFLRKLDPERYSAYSEEVQQMFRKKFKYEIYFWTVFLFGLLLIRVPQFLAKL